MITITVLKLVSHNYMASLGYGGKKSRDVGVTCRYRPSITMPDNIFYECIG